MLLLALTLAALLSGIGFLLWYFEVFPAPTLYPPPTWHGIVPGRTTETEAVSLVGRPDSIELRKGYVILQYVEHTDLDWEVVELWLQERENGRVVAGVLLVSPLPPETARTPAQLGVRGERPDAVMWTTTSGYRYLSWARQGLATSTAVMRSFSWNLPVGEVLLFEPMGMRRALRTDWPWPTHGPGVGSGWNTVNIFKVGDHADVYPQDPFDWREVPSFPCDRTAGPRDGRTIGEPSPTLRQVIDQYGCPDLIYVVDASAKPSGEYAETYLVYVHQGVEFRFSQLPPGPMDVARHTLCFRPGWSFDYVADNHPEFRNRSVAKVLSWADLMLDSGR